MKKPRKVQSIKDILQSKNFINRLIEPNVHVTTEFQDYGLRLASKLNDPKHKALYIKFAKDVPRRLLDQAMTFTLDYPTRDHNKGKLFMWKLGEICKKNKFKLTFPKRKKKKKKPKTPKFSDKQLGMFNGM